MHPSSLPHVFISGQPRTLSDEPFSRNYRFPHHLPLIRAVMDYPESHALRSYVPIAGQLPSELVIADNFIGKVVAAIDPAEDSWTGTANRQAHLQRHYFPFADRINDSFHGVIQDLCDLVDALTAGAPDPDLHAVKQKAEALAQRQLARSKATNVQLYPELAYLTMPFVLLQAYGLAQLASHQLESAPWLEDVVANIQAYLVYPVSDANSYALNLTHWSPYVTSAGQQEDNFILASVRLGRSQQRPAGAPTPNAVYLETIRITTVFHSSSDPVTIYPGLTCPIRCT